MGYGKALLLCLTIMQKGSPFAVSKARLLFSIDPVSSVSLYLSILISCEATKKTAHLRSCPVATYDSMQRNLLMVWQAAASTNGVKAYVDLNQTVV